MRKRRIIAMVLVVALSAMTATPAAAGGVVRLDFEKELVGEGVWAGTVDPDGAIRTFLTGVGETGAVWHLSFDWYVYNPDFVAEVSGVLNLRTGSVSLNGVVTDGVYVGSNIHIGAQLDLNDFSSAGTMTITP